MERVEGQRFGRYDLVRRLGKGGGGEAWEAVLRGPRGFVRPVALKFLPPGVAEGPELENLVNEARIGALLQHPNVVGTYELAEVDGVVFIALELVRGLTVRELARQGPLAGAALLDVAIQACAGLAHIHGTRVDGWPGGLVHRDIKPGNLLVDLAGVVKVADFGISRRAGDGHHTSGTPGYAPPEQFAGRVDARSDVYALGATIAALILREPPFGRARDGGTEVIARRLADPAFHARLDAQLHGGAAVLARCLQPDPADRWPSASALREAFAALRSRQGPAPSLRELVEAGTDTAPPPVVDLTPQLTPILDAEPTVVLRGNLPPATDVFFARPELAAAREALRAGRLVTLTGPGGMGKTRLALEVARAEVGGAAWWFDLRDATTLDGVLGVLAAALAIELGGAAAPTDRVGHALRALGRTVAVLDNLEQVLEPARVVIERVSQLAPELRLVATSRAPLRLPAEHRLAVGPLPTEEAVALFRARAPRVLHDVDLPTVRSLVAALHGMPLAIELVAARVGAIPLPRILARLDEHLAASAGDGEASRSVEASLRWSWTELPPWGRWTLQQLSVFEGGFTARAASAVLDPSGLGPHGPLDGLELLSEAGLLRYDADGRRFALPQIVRSFARARHDDLDRERARIRHGRAYATLGERDVLALLRGPQGVARFARLSADTENLVAALRRARDRDDAPVAVACLRALAAVLLRRGPLALLVPLVDLVAALPSLSPSDRDEVDLVRARCLKRTGQLAAARLSAEQALQHLRARSGEGGALAEAEALHVVAELHAAAFDFGVAEIAARQALDLARQAGDPLLEAEATAAIGSSLAEGGRWDDARPWLETALTAFQRLGSARDEARVLAELGRGEHVCGRFVAARATYRRALSACREVGDRVREIVVLKDLGLLEKDLRRSRDADALYREALHRSAEIGDRATECWLLGALGYLHLEQLDPADAGPFLEQAVAISVELSDPSQCQWEAALARLAALRLDAAGAARWLGAATAHERSHTTSLRVWIRCAAAEVAFRLGRPGEAEEELRGVERWLAARHVDPQSRMHQEVQRVRALVGPARRG